MGELKTGDMMGGGSYVWVSTIFKTVGKGFIKNKQNSESISILECPTELKL